MYYDTHEFLQKALLTKGLIFVSNLFSADVVQRSDQEFKELMSLTLAVGVRRALKMGILYHYTGVRGPPPEFYAKMERTRCILKLSVVWNY